MTADQNTRGKVLVVDDKQSVRTDLTAFLTREGYKVRVAQDAETGSIAAQYEEPDFAVVDLELGYSPNHSGIDAARSIARQRPGIRMVLCSRSPKTQTVTARLDREVPHPYGYVWTGDPRSNYLKEVATELRRVGAARSKRKCFVIMPFSETPSCSKEVWTDIFENLIKPAAESTGRYECTRSAPVVGSIITQIFDSLNSAEVVIADLTDRNANVFYELGVRHTLRDATILIAQRLEDVPFDLRQQATIVYDWKISGNRDQARRTLQEAMKKIEVEIEEGRREIIISPVRAFMTP